MAYTDQFDWERLPAAERERLLAGGQPAASRTSTVRGAPGVAKTVSADGSTTYSAAPAAPAPAAQPAQPARGPGFDRMLGASFADVSGAMPRRPGLGVTPAAPSTTTMAARPAPQGEIGFTRATGLTFGPTPDQVDATTGASPTLAPAATSPAAQRMTAAERNNARIMSPHYDPFAAGRDAAARGISIRPDLAGQTPTGRLQAAGYKVGDVAGAPAVKRLTGADGRTIYTNDLADTADWVKGGMKPDVSTIPSDQTALDRLTRANAIRQSYLDSQAGESGGPHASGIVNSDDPNATLARWGLERQLSRGDMGRTRLRALVDLRQADQADALRRDEMASRDAQAAARDATERRGQDLNYDRATAGFALDAEGKRLALNEAQQYAALRDRILNPTSTEDATAAEKQLRALQGRTEDQQHYAATVIEEPNPKNPMLNVRTPILYNTRTGEARPLVQQSKAPAPPAAAIDLLRQNPALAAKFDAKYGQGASGRYLNQPGS